MKLHLGCGRHYLRGWVNVDIVPHPSAKAPPDLISDVFKLPDIADGAASEIMAIHLFEHLYLKDARKALKEWNRVLKKGGRMVLEMPDLFKCCRNLLENYNDPKNHMFGIYGNHEEPSEWMYHRYGWSFVTIKPELEAAGFGEIVQRDPEWHGRRLHRDFRVECVKL